MCFGGDTFGMSPSLGVSRIAGPAEDCSSSLEDLQTQAWSGRLDLDTTSLGPSQVPLASRSLVGRIVSTESHSLRAEHILFLPAPLSYRLSRYLEVFIEQIGEEQNSVQPGFVDRPPFSTVLKWGVAAGGWGVPRSTDSGLPTAVGRPLGLL